MQQVITTAALNQALSFDDYMALTKSIIESPAPQGAYADEAMMRYTKSNWERMNKALNNTVISQRLYNQLSELNDDWAWVVLTEPWCGDASWSVPVLSLIASCTDKIELKIILRDTNLDIMKAYQTNGGNSIPKMVCLRKSDLAELGTWGPRPAILQTMVTQWKNEPDLNFKEQVRKIHAWYEADIGKIMIEEFSALVKDWKDRS